LILAESGTGKEKIAALIHALSERASNPLLILNCAAIPEQLAEGELFGQKKGAFTGATRDQKGKFEIADGGTVFLDEVGELPLEVQAKLLRAIDTGVIQPLGGGTEKKVDVRVIAATNLDLKKAIKEGRFREDLYYRLGAIEVRIPPLRERRSDIPKLAVHFLDEIKAQQEKPRQFAPETLATLQSLHWPGNVRELQNRVHQAAVLSRGTEIEPKDLGFWKIKDVNFLDELPGLPEGFSVEEFIKKIRLELYKKALETSGGKQNQAARLLGVTRSAVSQRLKKTPDL
jgi:transcriptional regulator with GAF, ATPase, and Fis domain